MAQTKVIWAPSALARLEEIAEFIARDFPSRAIDFVERLLESTDQLERYPLSGGVCPEHPVCRQLIVDGYRIIYEPSEASVDILTILAPGQDYERLLAEIKKR